MAQVGVLDDDRAQHEQNWEKARSPQLYGKSCGDVVADDA